MYGGRKSLVFILLSFGAGTLLWISAVYFRRKRRQRVAIDNKESSQTDEKPQGSSRRISGLLTRSQIKNKLSKDGTGNNSTKNLQCGGSSNGETGDRMAMIPDGRASDDSLARNPEELVDRLINKGVKEFEVAMEHWYEAAKHFLDDAEQDNTTNRRRIKQEGTLRIMLNCSRQLRTAVVMQGMAENGSYAVAPRSVLSWINSDSIIEESIAELEEKCSDNSDAESFVSASESAALEVLAYLCPQEPRDKILSIVSHSQKKITPGHKFDDLIEEKLISESSQLKMFRQTILKAAGPHSHLDFYVLGLEHYARCDVECRKMRTEVVGCESDMEFLAKVVCIRQASELAFSIPDNCTWMADTGRFMLSSVIDAMGKDPTNFEAAYDELLEFCAKPENWQQIHDELLGRQVPEISFYDVPLDFILLDAFDDLATPPYSVTTAIQNRWLSASIKETALTTALWGVLKAKASYLENQYGFMAHFYVVSQYILPCLAWGFMGPNEELKDLCDFFKEQILGYIRDVFSFDAADYSSVASLSESIIQLARRRSDILKKRLQKSSLENGL